jgi:hypothetical protein
MLHSFYCSIIEEGSLFVLSLLRFPKTRGPWLCCAFGTTRKLSMSRGCTKWFSNDVGEVLVWVCSLEGGAPRCSWTSVEHMRHLDDGYISQNLTMNCSLHRRSWFKLDHNCSLHISKLDHEFIVLMV